MGLVGCKVLLLTSFSSQATNAKRSWAHYVQLQAENLEGGKRTQLATWAHLAHTTKEIEANLATATVLPPAAISQCVQHRMHIQPFAFRLLCALSVCMHCVHHLSDLP